MIQTVLLLLLGLVVLLAAGESLVRGAANLARVLNVPSLIIALTVVAFGTSAPELVVTVQAVASDAAGIAMGNIIGSNIANILLVLGLPAILAPISLAVPRLRRHAVVLALGTALFCGVIYTRGAIAREEAILFSAAMIAVLAMMVLEARKHADEFTGEAEELFDEKPRLSKTLVLVIVGLLGLPIGAHLLVSNGTILAAELGVREEVIGLTIIAFGTSLPELATVLSAAIRKSGDVAAGSIIGSNIFNMLFVGAAAGFVGRSTFSDAALAIDLPVMMAATLGIVILIFLAKPIGRLLGGFSVLLYLAYIAVIGGLVAL
ncbi:MAG: calcium/sodium antiporter [Parvularcula sp.]|jgi:cation:H+ antiporter|nr:calcium/sodium antiporter [Parvularcula sp.]